MWFWICWCCVCLLGCCFHRNEGLACVWAENWSESEWTQMSECHMLNGWYDAVGEYYICVCVVFRVFVRPFRSSRQKTLNCWGRAESWELLLTESRSGALQEHSCVQPLSSVLCSFLQFKSDIFVYLCSHITHRPWISSCKVSVPSSPLPCVHSQRRMKGSRPA